MLSPLSSATLRREAGGGDVVTSVWHRSIGHHQPARHTVRFVARCVIGICDDQVLFAVGIPGDPRLEEAPVGPVEDLELCSVPRAIPGNPASPDIVVGFIGDLVNIDQQVFAKYVISHTLER